MTTAQKAQKVGSLIREARELTGMSVKEASRRLKWTAETLESFEKKAWEISQEDLEEMLTVLFDISICDFWVIMEKWPSLSREAKLAVVYEGIVKTLY